MSNLLSRIKKLEESLKTIDPAVTFIRRYPSGELTTIIVSRRFPVMYKRGEDEDELTFLESVEHIERMQLELEPFDKEKVLERAGG